MNDKQHQLHMMAIRERRKLLEMVYSKNGGQLERSGLVSLARVIFILAAKHVKRPEWPGHAVEESTELLWELEWYNDYLSALAEVVPPLQAAILNGGITPRGTLTRAPLDLEPLSPWLELNMSAAITEASTLHWKNARDYFELLSPGDELSLELFTSNLQRLCPWPDAVVMPNSIGVAIEDVSTWTESKGITLPGELATLMQKDADATNSINENSDGSAKNEYSTDQLKILAEAKAHFWENHSEDVPPKKDTVVKWIIDKGVSKKIAESMDTIMRSDKAKKGGNKRVAPA